MELNRSAGVLLHPSSLPCPYGIGDFGSGAYKFLDFLANAEIALWEILPLGPTGYGESPYQCFSAFAGNPILISPELLVRDGLLKAEVIANLPKFTTRKVDFERVKSWKEPIFHSAFKQFLGLKAGSELQNEFNEFSERENSWLEDYSLFAAIKQNHNKVSWKDWPKDLRMRIPEVLSDYRNKYKNEIAEQVFIQYLFFRQWKSIVSYAHERDVKIIGDIPLFVAYDSADVWANPELFDLDKNREAKTVAGVPPDYFSSTGQLWGNPHYRWANHKRTGYAWWKARFRKTLELVDILRLDHFRGFGGFWEVPAGSLTAKHGNWVKGPGSQFFKEIEKDLGILPIIAEDLGVITRDVHEMRDKFNFPGMRILQFGFGSDANDPFLPHNYPKHCVAFTGTHDNATARGWYSEAPIHEKKYCSDYLDSSGKNIAWDLLRTLWSSHADFVIAPMQDFLNLGNQARMNYPGTLGGNWNWRMSNNALNSELTEKIHNLNITYGRNSRNAHPIASPPIIHYKNRLNK
jgi:4-alpha-glucanotransferase